MGFKLCTLCGKNATMWKLLEPFQIAKCLEEHPLCNACAKEHDGFTCSFDGCTTAPQGGRYGMSCKKRSVIVCSFDGCTTAPQGGKYGDRCFVHYDYTPPIILTEETVKNLQETPQHLCWFSGDVRCERD